MYGTIRSDWEIHDGKITLKTAVPVNTTATVYVPTDRQTAVDEGPDYLHAGSHTKFLRFEGGYAVFEVESGTYEFVSQLPARGTE
jgi:alpha-L-rhamnosidase